MRRTLSTRAGTAKCITENGGMVSAVGHLAELRALPNEQREALITAFARSCDRISPKRSHRLTEILRRYVFGETTWKTLCVEFRISRRSFFTDRAEVLRRIAQLNETSVFVKPPSPRVFLREPSQLFLAQARAMFDSGNFVQAATLFDRIDDRRLPPGDRFEAIRLTIDALEEARRLPVFAEHIAQRIRRWSESTDPGSSESCLAKAADYWLRMRHGTFPHGHDSQVLQYARDAITLVRSALSTGDGATMIAYCRAIIDTIPLFLNFGDIFTANSYLQEMERFLECHGNLLPIVAGDAQAMRTVVHWMNPTTLRRSRVERRTVYTSALETLGARLQWYCFYVEYRDQLLQRHANLALTFARELVRSTDVAESSGWKSFAQIALIKAYLATGRVGDAEHAGALSNAPQQLDYPFASCLLAYVRRDFRKAFERSTQLVRTCDEYGLQFGKATALHLNARAAYRLGMLEEATSSIEGAVAIVDLSGPSDPLSLHDVYHDALLITGRQRYRDKLGDIMAMSRPASGRVNALSSTSGLSDRQRQVAQLAATNFTNDAIGRQLGISPRTVERHLDAVFTHFDVRSRHQLADVLAGG